MALRLLKLVGIVFVTYSLSARSMAQDSSQNSRSVTAAVDIKGVRHAGTDYAGKMPPWIIDRTKAYAPSYPLSDRAAYHHGSGLFRLTLDANGAVTTVAVLHSTGFRTLDAAAVLALFKWTWKPGKWKEIDMPVTFEMPSNAPRFPAGSVRLPSS